MMIEDEHLEIRNYLYFGHRSQLSHRSRGPGAASDRKARSGEAGGPVQLVQASVVTRAGFTYFSCVCSI